MRKLGKDVSEESSKSKSMQSSAEEDGNSESEIPIPEVEPQSFWWKRYLSKMSFFFSQMFEKKNKKLFFFSEHLFQITLSCIKCPSLCEIELYRPCSSMV